MFKCAIVLLAALACVALATDDFMCNNGTVAIACPANTTACYTETNTITNAVAKGCGDAGTGAANSTVVACTENIPAGCNGAYAVFSAALVYLAVMYNMM